MAEPLKNQIGRSAVTRIADRLASAPARVRRRFDRDAFVRTASRGLAKLELKDRVRHIARGLRDHLDPDYERALDHIVRTLGPPLEGTDRVSSQFTDWPLCQFVEEYGGDHFDASMGAIEQLTQRFSAEWAIRPFLDRDPDRALGVVRSWLDHASPHVRRLCSEGTRPRLPWGARLRQFQADPDRCRFVLDALVDDPELYVRRSVANHLNDVTRDHPEHAIEVARRWMKHPTPERNRTVRHALRTLIKAGHPDALGLRGYAQVRVDVSLDVTPGRVAIGGASELRATLRSRARSAQALLVDFVVHYVRADGSRTRKVFKWKELELEPGGSVELHRRLQFRQLSTRRHYPGKHPVEVQINGQVAARGGVHVVE